MHCSMILYIFVPEMMKMDVLPKLPKKYFLIGVAAIVVVLFIVRLCFPEVNKPAAEMAQEANEAHETNEPNGANESLEPDSTLAIHPHRTSSGLLAVNPLPQLDFSRRHRIRSVPSYKQCFPDVQDVQFPAALANGVRPVEDRAEAELRKKELLYVGANPYYSMDASMSRSIPYLVPKASHLLQHIGRRFLDSLAVKQIPLHTIIVTSVLRTEEDVRRLRRINGNASEQSCHRFGTTFDISYNRYHTVAPPDDPNRRAVRNDSLKFVLSEVLRDIREEGLCYIKYEVKQGCFHVTVR